VNQEERPGEKALFVISEVLEGKTPLQPHGESFQSEFLVYSLPLVVYSLGK